MNRLAAAVALVLGMALLAGCGSSGGDGTSGSTAKSPKSSGGAKAGASRAKTPTARVARAKKAGGVEKGVGGGPAAGVCPETRGDIVTVDLHLDTPVPRCAILHPGQRLRIVNLTGESPDGPKPVHLDFAGFKVTIASGEAALLDAPAQTYLGKGVHEVGTKGAPGPEVWVK